MQCLPVVGHVWFNLLVFKILSQSAGAIDKKGSSSKDVVPPPQTHNQENLITVYLMGQPYDGVYDVLGNFLLTPCSAPALFLPPQHS